MSAVLSILRRYMGDRVPDVPKGVEVSFCCPFHKEGKETSPSARINLDTGLMFCHGCHRGWNLRSLLKQLGVGRDSIELELAGVDLQDSDSAVLAPAPLYLPESILAAFHACPTALLRDGFTKATVEDFDVGWDRVHRRIVFPVRDYLGRLVGLQGRTRYGKARYVAYKDELEAVVDHEILTVKTHNHVWALERCYALGFYGELPELIIVEGQKKAMWLYQHGWEHSVALYGSYMTDEQHRLLSRLNIRRLVIMTDDDPAGHDCRDALVDAFVGRCHIVIPRYPKGKTQPDELDPRELREMISQAEEQLIVWQ